MKMLAVCLFDMPIHVNNQISFLTGGIVASCSCYFFQIKKKGEVLFCVIDYQMVILLHYRRTILWLSNDYL